MRVQLQIDTGNYPSIFAASRDKEDNRLDRKYVGAVDSFRAENGNPRE